MKVYDKLIAQGGSKPTPNIDNVSFQIARSGAYHFYYFTQNHPDLSLYQVCKTEEYLISKTVSIKYVNYSLDL
jgi:hypothetical protein